MIVQAQIRINRITLPPVTWSEAEGLAYAKANRLDLQNAQAAVTDAWRQMWVTANALRSDLNIVANAQVGTGLEPRNAFDFAADANRFRVGVQFDGPLNRLAERNAYRASQIATSRPAGPWPCRTRSNRRSGPTYATWI